MNIIITDDHTIVLEGLELLLSTFDFVKEIRKATNSKELLNLLDATPADVILLDIDLGKEDGREICRMLKKDNPEMRIIALTSYGDTATVKSATIAGFDGYLLKSEDRSTVMEAIQKVYAGEKFYSPQVKEIFFQQSVNRLKVDLTQREKEVLELIVEEKTTKEIAEILFISEKTVENHRSNLMLKLDVKNMAGLVKKALTLGYV